MDWRLWSGRNTKDKWRSVIDDMVARGSEGTDAELETIVDCLTANFGKDKPGPKVDKASASELVSALGLSQESATAIVAYREKNGA